MSSTTSTPRKRKLSNGEETPLTVRTKSKQGPPTPNPPLVPFPTPPHTRTRKFKYVEPVFPEEDLPIAGPSKQVSTELPPHLQTLLNIHHSFNLALSLYIATHPPILPPHPPSATSVALPNLTNFLAIKETVERTSGRRFGLQELGRLAWVWTWDGKALPDNKAVSEKNKQAMIDEDNPFLVPTASNLGTGEVNGLSYLITPTRTLDPHTGRRVYTHGIGIDLELRKGETRQVLHGGAEGGIGNKGQGGGMGAVGRWNTNGEVRHDIFRERLEQWVEFNGGYEPPAKSILPTPTTSENSTRSTIPPIPVLPLPHLPSSTLLPAANLFSTFSSPSTTLTPQKAHTRPSTDSPKTAGLSDPFELIEKPDEKKVKVIRPGSVDQRRQAMMERIKARSETGKVPATLGSSAGGFKRSGSLSAAGQHEELKRRSTLSRLENIAEGIWMMFSAPSPGPSTLPSAPRGRRKVIPMNEVADVIVKSSKTPISSAEAQSSLQLLTELCPFFLNIKQIGKQEWLEMPSGSISTAPPSPGSSITIAQPPPAIPGRLAPSSPSTPGRTNNAELAGPASPGRVRRGGGLREVRERIRRELEG
ncbi:uncharacterized protein I206_107473 [Kwoniella pini CBS 10737]|uniref:DNA replication factor Cdt1 C-terminal domain-containing protein n=1 Tax=Kwoniella pini CBS 10737 TaxID=1296096 RepID=A0A1B9HXD7_9TREE|nr:uncharacterized protein I206_05802 [Kwoniella pini CBS 10737]OCF47937.1 hypothetical protein I206_05802 [Kwoniella pini CBS 10737]